MKFLRTAGRFEYEIFSNKESGTADFIHFLWIKVFGHFIGKFPGTSIIFTNFPDTYTTLFSKIICLYARQENSVTYRNYKIYIYRKKIGIIIAQLHFQLHSKNCHGTAWFFRNYHHRGWNVFGNGEDYIISSKYPPKYHCSFNDRRHTKRHQITNIPLTPASKRLTYWKRWWRLNVSTGGRICIDWRGGWMIQGIIHMRQW